MNFILIQYEGPSQNSFMYSKLYTKRINNLWIPAKYQPTMFEQFNEKGNPKQHITCFVETCKNARIKGDLLVNQFVPILKPKPVKEEDTDLPQPRRSITLVKFLARNFHKNYQKKVLEVVVCHVGCTTEGENIPSSSSKEVEESKFILSVNIKDLSSLSQLCSY